jgi:hypothetical protein
MIKQAKKKQILQSLALLITMLPLDDIEIDDILDKLEDKWMIQEVKRKHIWLSWQ